MREWLNAQAAAGYVTYDPTTAKYTLPPEQAAALADETSPAFFPGLFEVAAACWAATDKMTQNFRTGGGLEWGHQHPCLFQGTERFFRSSYIGNLVQSWIPALDGVEAKLERGAKVADVGCGVGASTILMAKAFPKSTFVGFDYHAGSIELARKRAAGRRRRRSRDVRGREVDRLPGQRLRSRRVLRLPARHGGSQRRAAHVRKALAKDGTWMIVEPFASDKPEENHNAVGRVFYSASTMLCVPHSLAFGGPALGAQAGESAPSRRRRRRAASRASVARPRRRSTSCSKRARERERKRRRRPGVEQRPLRQVRPLQAPARRGPRGAQRRGLVARSLPEGARVLDVGCGFGDSTIRISNGWPGRSRRRRLRGELHRCCVERARKAAGASLLRRRRANRRSARPVRSRVRALRHDVLHVARRRDAQHPQVAHARRHVHADRVAQARGQPVAPRRRALRRKKSSPSSLTRRPIRCTAAPARSRWPGPTW